MESFSVKFSGGFDWGYAMLSRLSRFSLVVRGLGRGFQGCLGSLGCQGLSRGFQVVLVLLFSLLSGLVRNE